MPIVMAWPCVEIGVDRSLKKGKCNCVSACSSEGSISEDS